MGTLSNKTSVVNKPVFTGLLQKFFVELVKIFMLGTIFTYRQQEGLPRGELISNRQFIQPNLSFLYPGWNSPRLNSTSRENCDRRGL